jgi:hypothetical protein
MLSLEGQSTSLRKRSVMVAPEAGVIGALNTTAKRTAVVAPNPGGVSESGAGTGAAILSMSGRLLAMMTPAATPEPASTKEAANPGSTGGQSAMVAPDTATVPQPGSGKESPSAAVVNPMASGHEATI